ncbi:MULTISPECIES: potassium channel family protein [Spirosoma]|uniref:Potassium channel family protein n=1 Tax=Spirosoma liriopis TaxID=2937440 RepID=A0ABT0HLI8_9BACT|nr:MULTISPECIES: ion transporter [Spirosoma]MCK8492820.1 potassium channel family protein [Spirosoma liriopis]UHG92283.1 potassium channel family protein [Spirosoma oryzicola]
MNPPTSSKLMLHQVVTLVMSVYVVLTLLVRELVPMHKETRQLLDQIDTGVCIYFLFDFFVRLYQAPDKRKFLRWGWIDLLASIPTLDWLRLGQLVRVIRILRMVRAFRSLREFLTYLFRNRANGTLSVVLLSSVLLMIFGAISILYAERVPEANIKTPSDALWWAFVTITTVGYGDRFPVTTLGRFIAAVLMIAGVGLFGTFTGYVANFFVEEEQDKDKDDLHALVDEIRQLRQKIEALEKRLDS